jgi:hypothetical protein
MPRPKHCPGTAEWALRVVVGEIRPPRPPDTSFLFGPAVAWWLAERKSRRQALRRCEEAGWVTVLSRSASITRAGWAKLGYQSPSTSVVVNIRCDGEHHYFEYANEPTPYRKLYTYLALILTSANPPSCIPLPHMQPSTFRAAGTSLRQDLGRLWPTKKRLLKRAIRTRVNSGQQFLCIDFRVIRFVDHTGPSPFYHHLADADSIPDRG